MRSFTLVHDVDADVDTFWRVFFDPAFEAAQYEDGLGFGYTLLEKRDEPGRIVRRVRIVPKLDVPPAIAKLLGGGFAYEERGEFDRAARVWRWRNVPTVLASKLRNDGIVRAEASGVGRCRRVCEVTLDAQVLGLGGRIEAALEANLRHGWDGTARFMNRWIRDRRVVVAPPAPAVAVAMHP